MALLIDSHCVTARMEMDVVLRAPQLRRFGSASLQPMTLGWLDACSNDNISQCEKWSFQTCTRLARQPELLFGAGHATEESGATAGLNGRAASMMRGVVG